LAILICSIQMSSAQSKDSLLKFSDSNVKFWPFLTAGSINSSGKYFYYVKWAFRNENQTLYIRSLHSNWLKSVDDVIDQAFFANEERIAVLNKKKELIVFQLGKDVIRKIDHINSFEIIQIGNSEILSTLDEQNLMSFENLKTGKILNVSDVKSSISSSDNSKIFLVTKYNEKKNFLKFVDVSTLISKSIFVGTDINDLKISKSSDYFTFFDGDTLRYGNIKSPGEMQTIVKTTNWNDTNFVVSNVTRISNDGETLLMNMRCKNSKSENQLAEIWNYEDTYLRSMKTKDRTDFLFAYNVKTGAYKRIEFSNQTASVINESFDSLLKVKEVSSPNSERMWNKNAIPKDYVLNITTGQRLKLTNSPIDISPDGKYVICESSNRPDLNVYEISNGESRTFTKAINSFGEQSSKIYADRRAWKFVGWLNQENKLLAYDEYDIWLLDIQNPALSHCLTNEFGKRNEITLQIANKPDGNHFSTKDLDLLLAFDNRTKQNGFFRLSAQKFKDPYKLSMGDYLYGMPERFVDFGSGAPSKSKNVNIWMLTRQSASESSNIFVTSDFKNFNRVTDFFPEKRYNFVVNELIEFTTTDNNLRRGILYRPQNFDPTKKYPVIVDYYERLSDRRNLYLPPELSNDGINIPWFVSKGYLVFCPDIIGEKTAPGPTALYTVEGAAQKLSTLNFVDSTKIGLCGHSFGGYETNYIITHSTRFAAAVSSSGYADLFSFAVSFNPKGAGDNYQIFWAELGQGRIGYSLWERPDLYVANSALHLADKTTTPVMMMANENDGAVSADEGKRFFMALRRFNKPAWLFMYPNEDHSLGQEINKIDYTQKLEDFYGHYLKNAEMPEWMQMHN
jgi:dipeptidyl aminopeptidase/acylaminoacyl peptidase